MWQRFPMTPGLRRARKAALPALAALWLAAAGGCMYRLTGGGLPANIRTVFVESFENTTPYEVLRGEVQQRLRTELPRNLGVRLATQQNADAIVRGTLRGYDEQVVNTAPNTEQGRIVREQTRIQITFDAQIYDVKEDKVIWQGSGLTAIGLYSPDRGESVDVGRNRALDDFIQKVVQGAQSQW
jgi:Lipopolysaccharide-assembly